MSNRPQLNFFPCVDSKLYVTVICSYIKANKHFLRAALALLHLACAYSFHLTTGSTATKIFQVLKLSITAGTRDKSI